MHLFFTHVLAQLLTHSSPVYEQYYFIRHLFPPYSLYYYLLIALSRIMPLVWADKVIVAVAVANLAFGLRYLCTTLGRNGAVMAMLVFPVLLNWPLFMGFVNFTLSLGMAAWAIGIWTRLEQLPPAQSRAGLRVLFSVLLVAMTMTHPVPFGLVVVFCIGDLCMRAADMWRARRAHAAQQTWRRDWTFDALLLASMALCCSAYISAFTVKHIAEQTQAPAPKLVALAWLLEAHGLIVLGGKQLPVLLYRLSVYVVLLLPLALGVTHAIRRPAPRLPRWLIFAVVLILALPFIPPDLNASHLFRDRLLIVAWIAAIAAGSSSIELSRRGCTAVVTYAVIAALGVLWVANHYLRPVAQRIAEVESVPLDHHGPVGLVLPAATQTLDGQLFFDPYKWAGAHFVRRANGVLLNTPWLDLPIIPIAAREGHLLTGRVIAMDIEAYSNLRQDLLASTATRQLVFPQTDYAILIDRTDRTPASPPDPVLAADAHASWTCQTEDWFLICDRKPK